VQQRRIRFRLDERVTHAIARALRRRGIDVITATGSGTVGLPDVEVLARCVAEERVLVTSDKHILGLHERGITHAGIVYSAQDARSIGELVAFLVLVVDVLSPDEMINHVEFA
jgi:hypothetical protein